MIRRAKLYARFSDPDGHYPRVAVKFRNNGKAIEPTPPKNSHLVQFQIRVAGKFIGAGDDFGAAVDTLRQEEARLSGGVTRAEAIEPSAPPAAQESNGRVTIARAASEFVNDQRNKNRYTFQMYDNVLRDFQRSCRKQHLDEIERKDITTFIVWMRENLVVRVPGFQNKTLKNKLNYLATFLSRNGIQLKKASNRQGKDDPGLLYRDDIPRPVKKAPKKYDREQIELLCNHADEDQRDYVEFLLWSGWRDGEVMRLQYSDFDFKNSTVLVQAKPQFGWHPKDNEERLITLPTEVSRRMRDRMDRAQQYRDGFRKPNMDDVVFPNEDGNPDGHLIKRLHAVAKKAGLKLTGKRAGHMFRKTAGSRVARKLGLPAAMKFLGHSKLETTALYLADDNSDLKRKRAVADEMYAAGD